MMRFLVVSKPNHPMPPNPGLMDAMIAWIEGHQQSGKMEQVWGFAGVGGGGGILSVESLEELDAIMMGFPFSPFSTIEVYPLVDIHAALLRAKAVWQQAMPADS